MKQFFTLAVATMVALSAQAADRTFANNHVNNLVDISKGISLKAAPMQLHKAKKQAKAEDGALECFLGDFVHSQWCLDPESYEDWIGSNCGISIKDNGDGTVTIENILGYGNIQATYDADEEALVAAPGQFLFESTYGNVGLYPFTIDDLGNVDFPEDDILFYLDDENRFEILNDGIALILLDGEYEGVMLNTFYMFNQFDRVNATMTYLDYYKKEVSIGVAIDGTPDDGYVDVYGFGDISCVALEIDGEDVYVPKGQGVFYYSIYGMFYVYPLDEEGTVVDGEVTGTYNAETQSIALADFSVSELENSKVYDKYYNPVITWLKADEPVAIEQLNVQQPSTRIYDLQGRQVNTLVKGQTYVKGDGKMMVK